MTRVFKHYLEWEDWRAGMYATINGHARADALEAARLLLADHVRLGRAMFRVLAEWPTSVAVNLTDRASNRRAWMGQAACCLAAGVPEDVTREAWGLLTDSERRQANHAADATISYWESGRLGCQRDIWTRTF